MDDEKIVALYWDRNEQAVEETSAKYGSYCGQIARNILDSGPDAEECINDTWLHAWNAIPPQRPALLAVFLGRITRNLAFDRWRRNRSEKRGGGQTAQALDELTEIFPSSENVEQELEQRELMQAVTVFLQSLPEKHRNLFICRYWQSAAIAELAARFDMSESNVKVTLARIRKRLQKYLREEGLL